MPVCTLDINKAILDGLDDYTIDQRGDIGSFIRVEAIGAAITAIINDLIPIGSIAAHQMVALLCGLGCEKLDRVRLEAAQCLYQHWMALGLGSFTAP